MSRGLYVALSGAVAQQQALETTATNLANASTSGYQRLRPVFREVLDRASGNATAGPKKLPLHYAEISETTVDASRGPVRATGRSLDVALQDNNYLAVTTSRGERYTRAGSLTMSPDGTLTTASGAPLAREDGQAVKLSPSGGQASITPDGSVMQDGSVVAKLKIVKGDANTKLSHEGGGLMAARGGTMSASTDPLDVGVVEDSNANGVTAMTDLVTASRTFEVFQKMLDTFGDCDRKVLTTVPTATE